MLAAISEYFHDGLTKKALWETSDGSSFSVDDRLVIATALQWLLKSDLTSDLKFADLRQRFAVDIESSHAANTEAKREAEW